MKNKINENIKSTRYIINAYPRTQSKENKSI